jgi:hypothetical protein
MPRVVLPVLDAVGAMALAQQVEKGAEELSTKPPAAVVSAMRDVASAREALQQALGARMTPDQIPELRDIDALEDAAWAMLRGFLLNFDRLPEDHAARGTALDAHDVIFGRGGLAFTQLPVDKERAAADARMAVIKSKKLDKVICKLGGTVFWTFLAETHERYKATIDEAVAARTKPTARVIEALDTLKDSLDMYIVRVLASVDRDKPETAKRAEELLAPIVAFKATHKRKPKGKAKPGAPATPGAGPA